MNENLLPVVDYCSIKPKPERTGREGIIEAGVSIACGVTPIVGAILRSGLLFISGILFASWLGLIFGISAGIRGRRNPAAIVMATIGTLICGLMTLVFVQFLIHGPPC